MAEVSEHISEHVNVINIFRDANSILHKITNIHPKVGILLKVIMFSIVKTKRYSR